jgi:hypothetical protein
VIRPALTAEGRTKLGLYPAEDGNRRVPAVLTCLNA